MLSDVFSCFLSFRFAAADSIPAGNVLFSRSGAISLRSKGRTGSPTPVIGHRSFLWPSTREPGESSVEQDTDSTLQLE